MGPHLVQHHTNAGIGDLPGGFRAGEAGADDVNGFGGRLGTCHGAEVARFQAQWNRVWGVDTTTPAARRALSVLLLAESISLGRNRLRRAGCPSDQGRYRPVRDLRAGTVR